MIKEVHEKLQNDKPTLAPLNIWQAYEALDGSVQTGHDLSLLSELVELVSLIRRITGIDKVLTPYNRFVDKNFQEWVFKKQAGTTKFNEEQMQWLRMINDYVTSSYHIEKEDFDLNPFNA
jgi:type I restriction enzyme R subunit